MRQGDEGMSGRMSVVFVTGILIAGALFTFTSRDTSAADGEPRKVLLELITATWCATCPYADEAADQLSRDYGPERFVVLQYHVSLDGLDTIETNERRDDYGAGQTGLPAAWFDGTEGVHSVGEPDPEFFYGLYSDTIEENLEVSSPITISASITQSSGELTVSASFGKAKDISVPSVVHARYVLYENDVRYPPGSGVVYNYVVRDIEIKDFDYAALPYTEDVTFGLDSKWKAQNMGVVVFVQADTNGKVYQSANAYLASKPTVAITSDIDGKEITSKTRIEGTATGNVEYVMVRIDGKRYQTAVGTSSWHLDIDPSELDDGDHTVQVRAFTDSLVYSETSNAEFSSKSDSFLLYILTVVALIIVVAVLVLVLIRRQVKE